MVGARIVVSGHYLPEETVTTESFLGEWYSKCTDVDGSGYPVFSINRTFFDDVDELVERSGIIARRKASEMDTLDQMVVNAFKDSGFNEKDLGGIVVASVSSHLNFPNLASAVHEKIDGPGDCAVFDVVNACSGFMSAIKSAYGLLALQKKPVLVAGVERLSDITDYTERNCFLFGDGCGVAVLEPSGLDSSGILSGASFTDTSYDRRLGSSVRNFIVQDNQGMLRMPGGKYVLKKAVRGMYDVAKAGLQEAKMTCDGVSYFLPHQANKRIIEGIEEKIVKEGYDAKVINNIRDYGNMSAATQGVAYSMHRKSGKIKEGDVVVWTSMGSGLSYEAIVERV